MIHIFTKIFCCLRPNTGEMAPLPMAHMLVEPPPRTTTTPYTYSTESMIRLKASEVWGARLLPRVTSTTTLTG